MKMMGDKAFATDLRVRTGFALVELLVVSAIAGVLLMLMVPSMSNLIRTQRCVSLVNAFVASLHAARNEAIKRNGRTVLCKSADGLACTNSGGWEQGWITFHDVNNNAVLDVGETLIEQHSGVPEVRMAGNLQVANYVSYGATGTAKLMSGAFQSGTFTLCTPSDWEYGVRHIVLSPTGRPRITKGVSGDCL